MGFFDPSVPLKEQKRQLKELGWTVEKLEDRLRKINELALKISAGVNVGKNIIIWQGREKKIWIKLIDYRKGYWAEVPLGKAEFSELHNIIVRLNDLRKPNPLPHYLRILKTPEESQVE